MRKAGNERLLDGDSVEALWHRLTFKAHKEASKDQRPKKGRYYVDYGPERLDTKNAIKKLFGQD